MKRFFLQFALLNLFIMAWAILPAQVNPSFENWTRTVYYQEPVGYITFNFQSYFLTGAPNATKVPGVNGSAMRLETVTRASDTIAGYATNALGNIFSGGQAFSGQPDSVRITCRYSMTGNDSASFFFIFKAFSVPMINIINIGGSSSGFVTITKPLNLFLPADSLVTVIGSSNLLSNPVAGSWIEIDKIEFLGDNTDTLINYEFEDWFDVASEEADGWFSVNLLGAITGGANPPVPVKKTADASEGQLACEMTALELDLFGQKTVMGAIANSPVYFGGAAGGVPFTQKPTKFKFDYKYAPAGIDTAYAIISFTDSNGDVINGGTAILMTSQNYQTYTLDIDWTGKPAPDSMLIAFSATRTDGNGNIGSKLTVDNIVLDYSTGIETQVPGMSDGISLYPNPAGDQLYFKLDESARGKGTLRIYDMNGRLVAERTLSGEEVIGLNVARLTAGQYLYKWEKDGQVISGKFAKN